MIYKNTSVVKVHYMRTVTSVYPRDVSYILERLNIIIMGICSLLLFPFKFSVTAIYSIIFKVYNLLSLVEKYGSLILLINVFNL